MAKAKKEETSIVPKTQSTDEIEKSVEKKLVSLYSLQQIHTQIDKIHTIRGILPLEVQDLEDEVAGLSTRIDNHKSDIEQLNENIAEKKKVITDAKKLLKRYAEQQDNVRNNREYESLSKESEYQELEIQLAEKRIKEYTSSIEAKEEDITRLEGLLKERKKDLEAKQVELREIISETEKEEQDLEKEAEENEKGLEERILVAYKKIRLNMKNGLAVVSIERDACGGCFSKIPPQRQLDIQTHKKLIVCEHCGRILVDRAIVNMCSK